MRRSIAKEAGRHPGRPGVARLLVPATAAAMLFLCAAPAAAARDRPAAPPLTLRAAIAEALGRSPVLRPAVDQAMLSELRHQVAASRFGLQVTPTLTADTDAAGFGRRGVGMGVGKRFTTGTEVALHADSFVYGTGGAETRDAGYTLSLTQPLLRGLGPATTAELKDAARGVTSATRALDQTRQDLVVTVADAYYTALRATRLVETGERALERAHQLQAASEARTEVGLATRLDVLRADLLVSQAEAQLDMQRESLADSLDRLKIMLGRPLGSPLALAETELAFIRGNEQPGAPLERPAAASASDPVRPLLASALGFRTDVREARDRIGDARRAASVARWNLLPQVDLRVAHVRRGLGSPAGGMFDDLLGGWRVGLVTGISLDRAREQAAVAAAQIGVRAAEQALADLEPRVEADVRRAWRARERAETGIAIHTKALALAEQQLSLARLRYERGLADNFDMIDAESNLFQAESALIAAQVARALADLALDRVTGRLDPEDYAR